MRLLIIGNYNHIQNQIDEFFHHTNNRKIEILKQKFYDYIIAISSNIDCVGFIYLCLIDIFSPDDLARI